MKFFQETTAWDVPTPNHIYLLNDSKEKMYAYIKVGTKAVFEFKKPIRISTRGRKFVEVPNTFNYSIKEEKSEGQRWEVKGSKGDTYIVEKIDNVLKCTCSGFKFRGACKHTKDFENA